MTDITVKDLSHGNPVYTKVKNIVVTVPNCLVRNS